MEAIYMLLHRKKLQRKKLVKIYLIYINLEELKEGEEAAVDNEKKIPMLVVE
jgi:hypothetical protein